jgi:histidine triad (HIT) family protein
MPDGCAFCCYDGPFLEEGEVFIMEPRQPVTSGHVLVVPRSHVKDALENPYLTAQVMFEAAKYARRACWPNCNIITSAGAAATQTVFHLHIHIVPRRVGDGLKLPWSGHA